MRERGKRGKAKERYFKNEQPRRTIKVANWRLGGKLIEKRVFFCFRKTINTFDPFGLATRSSPTPAPVMSTSMVLSKFMSGTRPPPSWKQKVGNMRINCEWTYFIDSKLTSKVLPIFSLSGVNLEPLMTL